MCDLMGIAWDPDDCDADEAREYKGSTPGEIALQHAEWMHRQGDPQKDYNIRVRITKEGISREWYVHVDVEFEASFHAREEVRTDTVHYSHEAYQPDVHLRCGRWTTPTRSPYATLPELVYQTAEGDLYTFVRVELVTCEECKQALGVTTAKSGAQP